MVVLMMKKQFKSACQACGKIGHKRDNCFTLKKNKHLKKAYLMRMKDGRKTFNCQYCNKPGHLEKVCYKKKHDEKNKKEGNEDAKAMTAVTESDMILMVQRNTNINKTTWVADTGASCHMTNSLEGMTNLKDVNRTVTIGNGKKMVVKKNGTWNCFIIDKGIKKLVTLTDVNYIPELYCNLFAIEKTMLND